MPEPYPELEEKLRPLAEPLLPPRPGDWLAEHDEPGETFAEYLGARPVRKSDRLHTIYLCLVGDFRESQRRVLALTQEYLAVFFDCPVKVQRQVALASIPERARRTHPTWGDLQVLTGYVLHEVLEPERPADALAYLALTASDLWPGRGAGGAGHLTTKVHSHETHLHGFSPAQRQMARQAHGIVHGPGRSNSPDQGGSLDEDARRVAVPDRVVPVQRRIG
jgi:hypothetical protein